MMKPWLDFSRRETAAVSGLATLLVCSVGIILLLLVTKSTERQASPTVRVEVEAPPTNPKVAGNSEPQSYNEGDPVDRLPAGFETPLIESLNSSDAQLLAAKDVSVATPSPSRKLDAPSHPEDGTNFLPVAPWQPVGRNAVAGTKASPQQATFSQAGASSLPAERTQKASRHENSPAPALAADGSLNEGETILAPDNQVAAPAAFAEVDSSRLSETQRTQLNAIQENFIQAIGEQNPEDPAYPVRWQKARSASDEEFRAHFGDDAFNIQQMRLSGNPTAAN